jgi:hypothetical protein
LTILSINFNGKGFFHELSVVKPYADDAVHVGNQNIGLDPNG